MKKPGFLFALTVVALFGAAFAGEAAAQAYFDVPASALSAPQSALLAAAIINPRVFSPSHPSPFMLRRQQTILARMAGRGF